jgi:hypothetical protein
MAGGVTLSSLTHRTASTGPLPGEMPHPASGPEGPAGGVGGKGGAEGLMKQLLHKATFRGGPWDKQESSQVLTPQPHPKLQPPS